MGPIRHKNAGQDGKSPSARLLLAMLAAAALESFPLRGELLRCNTTPFSADQGGVSGGKSGTSVQNSGPSGNHSIGVGVGVGVGQL